MAKLADRRFHVKFYILVNIIKLAFIFKSNGFCCALRIVWRPWNRSTGFWPKKNVRILFNFLCKMPEKPKGFSWRQCLTVKDLKATWCCELKWGQWGQNGGQIWNLHEISRKILFCCRSPWLRKTPYYSYPSIWFEWVNVP